MNRRVVIGLSAASLLLAGGCNQISRISSGVESGAPALAPTPAAPLSASDPRRVDRAPVVRSQPIPDLSDESSVGWATTEAVRIDTRLFPVQLQLAGPADGSKRKTKEILPAHKRPNLWADQRPNTLRSGMTSVEPRAEVVSDFSGLDRTGWSPPDPSIAVGPNHIVETANQSIAWYTRDGVRQFSNFLNHHGSPGFFEPLGAGGFTFDPKCFYDHIAGRFVVLALETYNDDESYITFAVSDDDDPNGVWYKYRTDAVIEIDGTTFWWDYPGFGYDDEAYYVTGNLFGLSASGWGGAGFRIINKSSVLNGGTATHATMRSGTSASVQVCQHFGDNPAAYFVSLGNGARIRLHAITDPLTNPQMFRQSVFVPNFDNTVAAPVAGGGELWVVDVRIMNAQWRGGKVWAAHHVGVEGVNKARWYQFDVQDWPFNGDYSLDQSGTVDPGAGIHAFFPVIYTNNHGAAAMVFGTSSSSLPVQMFATGRVATDPPGQMGAPVLVRSGTRVGSDGRWGDYYDIALDPGDGMTFWAIGETDEAGIGWDTRITSFTVSTDCPPDLTGDGVVDSGDLALFISLFIAGDPTADFTGDGVVDSGDLAGFINAFIAGC